jgi:hypothetical protein
MEEILYKTILNSTLKCLSKETYAVFETLKKARIIILQDDSLGRRQVTTDDLRTNVSYEKNFSFPLPFETTWIERQNKSALISLRTKETPNILTFVTALLIECKKDSSPSCYALRVDIDSNTGTSIEEFVEITGNYYIIFNFIEALMFDIRAKAILLDTPFINFFPTKKHSRLSRILKPNPIIRVVLNRELKNYPKHILSQHIDWSHRWEVRGHWRKVSGIGKDSTGEYCVNGFTWVKDQERGKQGVPVTKKTRIFLNKEAH